MKKTIFIVLLCNYILNIQAQKSCSRTVQSFGSSSGNYLITGSVILSDTSGTLYVTLSNNFYTDNSPDLHLHLSIMDAAPTVNGNTNVEIGLISSNSGAQSYTVPGNYSLDDFDYVLIHCKQYNAFWDGGLLDPKDCIPTAIKEPSTQNYLQIVNSLNPKELSIALNSNDSHQLDIYICNNRK